MGRILLVVVALGLFIGQAFIGEKLRKTGAYWVTLPRVGREMNPLVAKILSFGHLPVRIDWYWLRVMQDPTLFRVDRETRSAIFYELDLITQLDPAFFDAYMWGSILLSVVRGDALGAKQILLRGEQFRTHVLPNYKPEFQKRFWKQGWGIPFTLAYVYLFDLDDLPRATVFYRKTSELPGTPAFLKTLVKKLETVDGQYEAGIKVIEFFMKGVKDPKIYEKYKEKREWLIVGRFLYQMNTQFKSYLEGRPEFHKTQKLEKAQIEKYFNAFLVRNRLKPVDPFGAQLFINREGNIDTQTSRKKVFGMEY